MKPTLATILCLGLLAVGCANWERRAAEGGDPQAQYNLGVQYESGALGERSDDQAAEWYRKAAEQGYAPAQFNLAALLAEGRGLPQDLAAAAGWYRKAAEQGDAQAQYNLAVLYDTGEGVDADPAEAARLYRLAADQDLRDAQFNMALISADGIGVPRDDTAAAGWFLKAANAEDADAQFLYGVWCYEGRGVTQDAVEAYRWLSRAAAQGHARAPAALEELAANLSFEDLALGVMAGDERKAPDEHREIAKLYRKAIDIGDAEAQFTLGEIAREGKAFGARAPEAVRWYGMAAEQGFADAEHALGRFHDGKNDEEAVNWYRRAAERGHGAAQRKLADFYAAGRAIEKNLLMAYVWYTRAAGHDNPAALEDRGRIVGEMTEDQIAEAERLARDW